MTLALRFAARSDVGLRREGNEDSAYAGPHLLAVADGMGGHAAGEVASSTVITTIADLDAEHSADDLPVAIRGAVASASQALRELIVADSARQGMGTTLTALLWTDEGHVAVGHIGDSRAYLLRDGQFYQITRDHTKVQVLLEQGKITEAELETHPQRSVLVRALDGLHPVRPDVSVHEALPGDRYLLCSDGLSGVAPERAIFQTLTSIPDPEATALRLIEIACRGGGPDNITCIVADVIDTAASGESPTREASFAGAAADSGEVSPPDDSRDPGLTSAMPQYPAPSRPEPTPPEGEDVPRAWQAGRTPAPEPRRPEPEPRQREPEPRRPEPERPAPAQPAETARLREALEDLRGRLTEVREHVSELDTARERQDARLSDLSGEGAETRTEVRDLRTALDQRGRGDGTLSMALAAQMREIKKLKADFLTLRDNADGGDTPSSGIVVRWRETAEPSPAADWPVPPDLADDSAPPGSATMAGYAPRVAGYSLTGADLIRRRATGPAQLRDDENETEGDSSDQPWD